MAKQSKRYRALAEKVKSADPLEMPKAVATLKEFGGTKFDQTVEVAIRLGIDAKQADQLVRGSIVLPNGIGKTQRVVVFAKGDVADAANEAGADEVGQEDLAKRIKDGWLDFDACIAAPDMMGMVGPLGRVLGPRGLMPSPRAIWPVHSSPRSDWPPRRRSTGVARSPGRFSGPHAKLRRPRGGGGSARARAWIRGF